MKRSHRLLSFVTLLVLFFSFGCNLPFMNGNTTDNTDTTVNTNQNAETVEEQQTDAQTDTEEESQGEIVEVANVYPEPFAEYPEISVRLPETYIGGYTFPLDLTAVMGIENFNFTQNQLGMLSDQGFTARESAPGEFREFYQVYEFSRYSDTPVFVTTDSVLHVYHLIFDKMLRDLEREYFIPTLEELVRKMLIASGDQYTELLGTDLEQQALANFAYFCVAATLLEMDIPNANQAAIELANQELSLINNAAGAGISPIWDREDLPDDEKLIEDYSQYIPRGHYTRSEELKKYFKAMMWFGRMTYRLNDTFETQRALLMTHAIRSTEGAESLWQLIYDPTVFIVGKSDDLSFSEYGALSDEIYGTSPALSDFADPQKMETFIASSEALPPPQVNSMWVWIWQDQEQVTKGFRFMGQRFTLDQYVFGQLMWRKVGSMDNPRDLPKGLDLLAAMGSDTAYTILDDMGETDYENYTTQMEKVKGEISQLGIDTWTQNLYWNWLYTLQTLVEPKTQAYPQFMQTEAWTLKELNTAMGSWTELKHDTILYAKQVMAEMGGGPGEDPPRGYVEPNPELYARLYALSQMTLDGLTSRNILSQNTQYALEDLMDLLQFLQSVAEKELNGDQISDDDYWRLKYYGGELESLTILAADSEEEYSSDLSDQKAALVADVATGMERVLEEAIGQPAVIYIVAPDDPWRIAVGAIFSYYEFEVPPSDRMTDETWQEMVESGNAPDLPGWTTPFMVPAE